MKLSYVNYNIRQGEAKLHLLKLTSVYHHLPRVSPKQLCASAHSGYFLVGVYLEIDYRKDLLKEKTIKAVAENFSLIVSCFYFQKKVFSKFEIQIVKTSQPKK